jgi:6-phosphogluconolactonase
MHHDTLVLVDPDAVAEAATEILVASANTAVEVDDRFVLALSGGPPFGPLYRRLAQPEQIGRIPWDRTWVLFCDERCVGPEDAASRYRQTRDGLLNHVPVAPDRVLRIEGEQPQASRAAHFYEERLRALFPGDDRPRIDVALVGIGPEGETAALHPGSDALHVEDRWATAVYLSDRGTWSVTLTLPALRAAHQVVVLATGEGQAETVARAYVDGGHDDLPVRRVVPDEGHRVVLLDEAAAARIPTPA